MKTATNQTEYLAALFEKAITNVKATGAPKRLDIMLSDEGLTNCPSPFSDDVINRMIENTIKNARPVSF